MVRDTHWLSITGAFYAAAVGKNTWYSAPEGFSDASGSHYGQLIGLGATNWLGCYAAAATSHLFGSVPAPTRVVTYGALEIWAVDIYGREYQHTIFPTASTQPPAPTYPASIVGAWTITEFPGATLAFLADGTYVQSDFVGADTAAGWRGMERGTYTYDPATSAFATTCPTVDTNGDWAFPTRRVMSVPAAPGITGSGDTLSFSDGVSTMTSNRVVDAAIPAVGSWHAYIAAAGHNVVITFFSDGTYIHAEDGPAEVGVGQRGIEYSTYNVNPSTGAFTSACLTSVTNVTTATVSGAFPTRHRAPARARRPLSRWTQQVPC